MLKIEDKKYPINQTRPITNLSHNCLSYIGKIKYLTDATFEEANKLTNLVILYPNSMFEKIIKLQHFIEQYNNINWIGCANPEQSFLKYHNLIYPYRTVREAWFTEPAYLHIDKDALIYQNFDFQLGKNVRIGKGAVIGGHGFKIIKNKSGNLEHLTHVGGIKIGDDCFIKAAYIDRATFEGSYTELKNNVFIDNGVHIGHNVLIQENTLIVANSVIGGSVVINSGCWIGEGVTIREGLTIGKNVFIGMGSVVASSIEDNKQVAGHFAMNKYQWLKFVNSIK